MWQAHLDGTASDQYRPWLVMKVQAWLEAQGAHQGLFSSAAAA